MQFRIIHNFRLTIIRHSVYNGVDKQTRKDGRIVEYMSCAEAAGKWGISERRVQKLCEEKRIPGVAKFSFVWLIPKDAEKPADKRYKEKSE